MIMSIIYLIIGKIKLKIILNKCLLPENETTTESFTYKGKKYNRKKFIKERSYGYQTLSKNNFKKIINDTKKLISEGDESEFYKADLDALFDAYETVYHTQYTNQ